MSDDDVDACGTGADGRRAADGGAEVEGDGGVISLEAVLGCLLAPRRRFVLYYLQERETATVDELARQVAAWERGIPPEEVDADHRRHVETALVHRHLPKLADALFVEYDERSDAVRYTEPPALLEETLRLLARLENGPGE